MIVQREKYKILCTVPQAIEMVKDGFAESVIMYSQYDASVGATDKVYTMYRIDDKRVIVTTNNRLSVLTPALEDEIINTPDLTVEVIIR